MTDPVASRLAEAINRLASVLERIDRPGWIQKIQQQYPPQYQQSAQQGWQQQDRSGQMF